MATDDVDDDNNNNNNNDNNNDVDDDDMGVSQKSLIMTQKPLHTKRTKMVKSSTTFR